MGARELFNSIIERPLEDVMGERFGRYSKYIIQERALPDARDGLKPVQRRVIYSMNKEGNVFDKAYRKSAKTVGNVIGNYHPHGDTSVYDAMVRMSQWWKVRHPLIDMHGNNGSIDNDPAAAMRYTEARMSKISSLLVEDINKNTIKWTLNFDDTEYEPSVLPSKYPNLLVNGAKGIASGYATDIPPHNLAEIIDATIFKINKPDASLAEIMRIVKGPDFPTGGIVMGKEGIEDAFKTGKGKVVVRAKAVLPSKKSEWKIIINEIPYDVVKSNLVREIDEVRARGDISGILEVRDESDRNGLQIAIDLKPGADAELILNFLFKTTQLQTSYNYNMVAIVNKRPLQLGLLDLLSAYIEHQREVVIKRSEFDLEKLNKRSHIVEGLIKAVNHIDEVIRLIRLATGKTDAKNKIINALGFSEEQAEAIVTLRLYRLSSTDVFDLEEEFGTIQREIRDLIQLLNDPSIVNDKIKDKLKEIKEEFYSPRLSEIVEEVEEIKISKEDLIDSEDVHISISENGYIKRSSTRSFLAAPNEYPDVKDDDNIIAMAPANTLDKLLIITSLGNYLYIPVFDIAEKPWRHFGEHMSTLCKVSGHDKVITAIVVKSFDEDKTIVMASKSGLVKRTKLSDFEVSRYSRAMTCMKLKEKDKLVSAHLTNNDMEIMLFTRQGYVNKFYEDDVSVTGIRSSGIKGITVRDDHVVSAVVAVEENAILFTTDKGQAKRMWVRDVPFMSRTTKGIRINKVVKSNPQNINFAFVVEPSTTIRCRTNRGDKTLVAKEIPLNQAENGNTIVFDKNITIDKALINSVFISSQIVSVPKRVIVNEVDDDIPHSANVRKHGQLSLDDFDI